MRTTTLIFVSFLSMVLALASVVNAGGKGKNRKNSDNSSGTIEFILEHATELKITLEQTQKLNALLAAEETIMADPVISAMMQKVRDARKSGNAQAMAEQRQRVSDKIKEKTNGKYGLPGEELAKILTPEQKTALAALRNKNAPAAGADGGTKEDSKPAEGKMNPFEL